MRTPTGTLFRVALLVASGLATACGAPEHSIVPMPREAETGSGTFALDANTTVVVENDDDEVRRILDLWAAPLRETAGLPLSVVASPDGDLRLGIDGVGEPESYRLEVTPGSITVRGADGAGLFYGLQTLSQLLPPDAETTRAPEGGFAVQAITIDDAPRFTYRGMHLDVARHFFEPEFVKRYVDLLARYKLNRFHWHLTDDQGWRIQIDAYPRLTEIGGFRPETQVGHGSEAFQGDGQPNGGFYTKAEVREIVAYAQERFVTIVPEIEMPGHATAALAAYPEFACTDGPFEVAKTWGVFEDVFCPYEETFAFLETVVGEVIELFPGEYVHLGGDEAPTARWEDSPYVRRLMQREGMNDVTQVQSWFMRRMARFLAENGKRLVGWDEILEGGLPPDAAVMSWRGILGGIEASRQGHPVIMTPNSHLYFDYYQSQEVDAEPFAIGGFLPLDTVYAYDPVPRQLREADARQIIGAQANVWTEYMKTPDQVEYMLLPRMLALAEVVWSPREVMDFDDFLDRLQWQTARLDALDVRYRPLDR
jgi:hexosaminidase